MIFFLKALSKTRPVTMIKKKTRTMVTLLFPDRRLSNANRHEEKLKFEINTVRRMEK